jgi:beta-lactam-binding protein with PASTA domain
MRTRRHVAPSGVDAAAWGRFLRDLAIIAVVAAIGFGVTSSWVNPGPILDADHAVPRVVELSETEARKALAAAGFRPRVEGEWPSPEIPRGTVAWQDPPPDMVLPANTVVDLVLSAGPAPVTVPDVVGMSEPFAEKILEAAGVKVGSVDTVRGGDEAGVVLSTRPPPGHGRARGTRVDLVVSAGPAGMP